MVFQDVSTRTHSQPDSSRLLDQPFKMTASQLISAQPVAQPIMNRNVSTAQPIILDQPVMVSNTKTSSSASSPGTDVIWHRYACPYCHKTFSSTSNLRPHIDWHENRRKFVCVQCGKSYRYNKDLKNHMLSGQHFGPD